MNNDESTYILHKIIEILQFSNKMQFIKNYTLAYALGGSGVRIKLRVLH